MRTRHIAFAGLFVLAACHGPAEKAGEEQDKVNADAAGLKYTGKGPNERIGKAVDRADQAAQNARDASAEAVKKQGDKIRRDADIDATRLDEQARAIRANAALRADALNNRAKSAP